MGKILLVMVLIGGVGFGAYHFLLKPKPAFDVDLIEDQLDLINKAIDGKRAILEGLAGNAPMPASLSGLTNYMDRVSNVLENHWDCAQTATDLRKLANAQKGSFGLVDQHALMAELSQVDRNRQQELAAKMTLVMLNGLERLVPLVDDYCDACPKESAVFHEVLF